MYFETSTSSPYQIRRIEELNKVRIDTSLHFGGGKKYEHYLFCTCITLSYSQFQCVNLFNVRICIGATTIQYTSVDFLLFRFSDRKWECGSKSHVLLQAEGFTYYLSTARRQASMWVAYIRARKIRVIVNICKCMGGLCVLESYMLEYDYSNFLYVTIHVWTRKIMLPSL